MPRWTDEQRRAIDINGDILVSAGAGSGKTAVLTERIVRLVREGLDIKSILCVTFTVSAANEMKKRIERALYSAADGEKDENESARLHAAARACPGASISTLHSFCNQVLKRHFNEAGLDPAFRIADTSETGLMRDDAWDELCEARLSAGDAFASLIDALGDDETAYNAVSGLYDFTRSQADPDAYLDEVLLKYMADADSLSVSSHAAELIAGSSIRLRLAADTLASTRDAVAKQSPVAASIIDDEIMHARMIAMQSSPEGIRAALDTKPHPDIKKITWGKCADEVKKAADDARKKLNRALDRERRRWARDMDAEAGLIALQAPLMRELCCAVRDFEKRFSAMKHDRGVIDYADMEHMCLGLLRNADIAGEYRRRFSCIFMDEYQDCNAVQEELIRSVSNPGALFLVGDVKQSIYRFRLAEPSLFIKRYASYADGKKGVRIDLNANFRSSPGVIDAVNAVFSDIMTADAAELDYDKSAALVHGRSEDGAPDASPRAEFTLLDMLSPTPSPSPSADEDGAQETDAGERSIAKVEAAAAARKIHALIEHETVFDPALGRRRSLRYSDFAVLLRSYKGVAAEWLETLSLEGIPAYGEVSGGFFDAVEVKLFIDLIRIIDNRTLDIPMAAVLRSPIGGFTTQELIELKTGFGAQDTAHGEGWRCFDSLSLAAQSGTALGDKAKAFIERLSRWQAKAKLVSVETLLGELMDETDYGLFCRALPGGRQREANLDALCEKARLFETTGARGLHAFLDYSDKLRASGDTSAPQSAGANVVRVMSVHGSKGLEFPVVLLGGLAKRFNTDSSRDTLLADPELGVGVRFIINGVKSDSLYVNAIASRAASKGVAEEMRVLYVAMTRAREKLIMLCASRDASKLIRDADAAPKGAASTALAKSFAEWLLSCLIRSKEGDALRERYGLMPIADAREYNIAVSSGLVAFEREGGERMSQSAYTRFRSAASLLPCPEGYKSLFERKYAFAPDTGLPSKVSVTGLAGHEIRMSEAPDFLLDERMSAADRGTAFHAIMQRIDIAPHTEASVRDALENALDAGYMSRAQVDAVNAAEVAAFFSSELGKRLTAAQTKRREMEFNISMSARELGLSDSEGSVILQGVVDCCFIENGEWVLIDYKTDRVAPGVTAAEAAVKHTRQVALYARALARLTNIPVKRRYIYFFGINAAAEIEDTQTV